MNLPFNHPRPEPGDPGSAYDARPSVAIRRQDRSAWWFAGGALIAAVLLFSALEARRRGTEQAGEQAVGATSFAGPEAVPELEMPFIPDQAALGPVGPTAWARPEDQRRSRLTAPQPRPQPAQTSSTSSYYPDSGNYQTPPPPPPQISEQASSTGMPSNFDGPAPSAASGSANRIMAGRLENPSTTVVQGTLINAVLETALDSTRPGQTRALVTRDIYGFDGTKLLIPRGARLYGVYESDVAQGQKRAQIRWTRLLRPDGVSVALDSPAADPLGRAGVEGRVDNHFFQRFGNALLGTTANIGSALATRSVAPSSPVIVAVPGATQSASQAMVPSTTEIAPTLTVDQGTRITVFVQHDLDFTSADEAR